MKTPRNQRDLWLVGFCLLLSGGGSLVLEVVWSRMLKLVFGSTTLAVSTILVAYMLGLGLGGLLGGRIASRLRDGVKAYGLFEIAIETTLLAFPGPPVRTFRSDFPTRSRKIRRVVSSWKDSLPRRGTRPITLPKRRVSWADRFHDWQENRVALALNPPTLTGTAFPEGDGWRLEVCATVVVNYAPDYALHLFTVDGRAIVIEEGIFRRLAEEGWMYPYDARWCWTETMW